MGQANVKRWIGDLMPFVEDAEDPLGVEDLATHRVPLEEAPRAYEMFQKKEDGAIKVLLAPHDVRYPGSERTTPTRRKESPDGHH
jgi:threonine dehydrogenase-like Zn-dependent dehydrogenase